MDFTELLEILIISNEPLVITGDFNIDIDNSHDPDANRLLDLFESMGLCQHVNESTHEHGHTLDLMITRASDSIIWGHLLLTIFFRIISLS